VNTDKPTDASLTPEKTVADVMNTDVVTVQLNDAPPIADDTKYLFDACYFPVLDSGKLAGIVDQSVLVGMSLRSRLHRPNEYSGEKLAAVAVKELMTPAARVSPDVTIHGAANTMVERSVECQFVIEGETLLRLVTKTNLLRELAHRCAK
jgi:CBS-domain-containing membrane protein